MAAELHNRVLHHAVVRGRALESKLADLLVPVIERAGVVAARNFERYATSHVAAAAELRVRDCALVAAMNPAEAAALAQSFALSAAAPAGNSTMVCVKPRPEQADAIVDPDGETADTLHVTLVYLGEIDGPLDAVVESLKTVGVTHAPLQGIVGGYGQFGKPDGGAVGILLPDVPGLVELRVAVTDALVKAGVTYAREHGFEAHITVDATPEPGEASDMLRVYGSRLNFDELLIVRGDTEVIPVPLVGVPALTAAAKGEYCLPAEVRTKTNPVRLAVIKNVSKTAVEGAGLTFDISNPFIQKMLAHSAKQITEISKTTQLDVMRAIRASYEAGLSIPDTGKAIRAAMKEAAPDRAVLIARTELAGAVNGASLAGTQIVSEATGIEYAKSWMTAAGARFPRHEDYPDLDGQEVALDDYFEVGEDQLEFPGDPNGSPEEVCNCRCTMQYVDQSGNDVGDEVESVEASALPCEAHAHAGMSIDEQLAEVCAALSLTSAATPNWTAPAPSEILNVDCAPHVVAPVSHDRAVKKLIKPHQKA